MWCTKTLCCSHRWYIQRFHFLQGPSACNWGNHFGWNLWTGEILVNEKLVLVPLYREESYIQFYFWYLTNLIFLPHFSLDAVIVLCCLMFYTLHWQCLLVKGWKGTSWSFPRGKKNKDEEDHACAIREVSMSLMALFNCLCMSINIF